VKAEKLGVNLQDVLDKKITLTSEQLALFEKEQLPIANTSFAGVEIHNLFEFFMVFVVLCGVAAVILAIISPRLKKMMHGVS
jgi:POT family proton-dependent oligopeptide transporter